MRRSAQPDPDELPDELDFDPDEPKAAPANPFNVEDRPKKKNSLVSSQIRVVVFCE